MKRFVEGADVCVQPSTEISSLLFARTQRRLPHLLAPLNWAGLEPNRASKLLATLFRWLIEPMPHLQGDGMRPQGQKQYWPDDECAHDEQDTA